MIGENKIKEELITDCQKIIGKIEKTSIHINEYYELDCRRIFRRDSSYYDDCNNYNGVYYIIDFEDGKIRQRKEIGDWITNTYYGNYLDEFNIEELYIILENLISLLNDLIDELIYLKEDEEEYERKLNQILFKRNYNGLKKLSKKFNIII